MRLCMFNIILIAIFMLSNNIAYSIHGHELFSGAELNVGTISSMILSGVFSSLSLVYFSIDLKKKLLLTCVSSLFGGLIERKSMQSFYGKTRFSGENAKGGHIVATMPIFGDQTFENSSQFYRSATKTLIVASVTATLPTICCAYYLQNNHSLVS